MFVNHSMPWQYRDEHGGLMYCYYDNIVSMALDVAMVMEWRAEILEWSTIVTLANLRSLGFFGAVS